MISLTDFQHTYGKVLQGNLVLEAWMLRRLEAWFIT